MKKVYAGLKSVERGEPYHLGHYEVDFEDGCLRFEVHAGICANEQCPCDDLLLEWHTEQTQYQTWYTAEREWFDGQRKALNPDLISIFQSVEQTATFRERIAHLHYLRRAQVLEQTGKTGELFEIHVPHELLLDGHNPQWGILGKVRLKEKGREKAYPYSLQFCDDASCFCGDLFLLMGEAERSAGFRIDPEDQWQPTMQGAEHQRLTSKVRTRLMNSETFRKQLTFFRLERRLQNYHRFVHSYASQVDPPTSSA